MYSTNITDLFRDIILSRIRNGKDSRIVLCEWFYPGEIVLVFILFIFYKIILYFSENKYLFLKLCFL